MREEMTKSTASDCHRWRAYKRNIGEQGRSHMLGMTTTMIIYKGFFRNENQTYEEMPIVVIDGKDNKTLS